MFLSYNTENLIQNKVFPKPKITFSPKFNTHSHIFLEFMFYVGRISRSIRVLRWFPLNCMRTWSLYNTWLFPFWVRFILKRKDSFTHSRFVALFFVLPETEIFKNQKVWSEYLLLWSVYTIILHFGCHSFSFSVFSLVSWLK